MGKGNKNEESVAWGVVKKFKKKKKKMRELIGSLWNVWEQFYSYVELPWAVTGLLLISTPF